MNTTWAKIISYVFQPLFMPLLTVILAFNFDPYLESYFPPEAERAIYSVIGLNTFLVPTLLILYLKRLKIISSIDVENRRERFIPFMVTLVLYITTYVLIRRSPLPETMYSMISACIIAMILAFVITMAWKISIHMTGIGGVVGAMCALFDIHMFFPVAILSALVLLGGFIGTARMVLGIHTLAQIICGSVLGFTVQFVAVKYSLFI